MKKAFKELFNLILEAQNADDLSNACGCIEIAFNHEKITYKVATARWKENS